MSSKSLVSGISQARLKFPTAPIWHSWLFGSRIQRSTFLWQKGVTALWTFLMGDLSLGTSGKKGDFDTQALPQWSSSVRKPGPLGHQLCLVLPCEVIEFVPLNP